jgi:protein-arginine kinase activator protein McsA
MPSKDKEKQKLRSRKHYEQNREKILKQSAERQLKLSTWVNEYKSSRGCSRCPENDSACLDCHHTDPSQKKFAIGYMIKACKTLEDIQLELTKCIILCANCHRKLHRNEQRIL